MAKQVNNGWLAALLAISAALLLVLTGVAQAAAEQFENAKVEDITRGSVTGKTKAHTGPWPCSHSTEAGATLSPKNLPLPANAGGTGVLACTSAFEN